MAPFFSPMGRLWLSVSKRPGLSSSLTCARPLHRHGRSSTADANSNSHCHTDSNRYSNAHTYCDINSNRNARCNTKS